MGLYVIAGLELQFTRSVCSGCAICPMENEGRQFITEAELRGIGLSQGLDWFVVIDSVPELHVVANVTASR